MITVNNTQIKHSFSELTIKEYEVISSILNDNEKDYIDKWSEIFIFLGVDENSLDSMVVSEFIEAIKNFNLNQGDITDEIKQTITLNGIDYYAFKNEEEFKITVKEMNFIENAIKHNDKRYIGDVLAIIYKNPQNDKTINFDKAHIHFKAELIRKEITADIAIPILNYLGKIVIKNFDLLNYETN